LKVFKNLIIRNGLKEENCQVLRAKPDSLCVIFGGMLCLNYFIKY
jgi:hypothetical protein